MARSIRRLRMAGSHRADQLHEPGRDARSDVRQVRARCRRDADGWAGCRRAVVSGERGLQPMVVAQPPIRSARMAVAIGDLCALAAMAHCVWGFTAADSSYRMTEPLIIAKNDFGSRLAPPTSAPSTSGSAISLAMLSGLTLPPYSTRH